MKSEFARLVETQLNQQAAWKIAEIDWKSSMQDRETKLQADMGEMQSNILGKIAEHFQHVDEQQQHNDTMLRQEVALLTAQLVALQQVQNSEAEVRTNDCWEKLETRQTRLIEDVVYIQYVVEEIATRPICIEAQLKLRENFFIREIATLKEEVSSVCNKLKSTEMGCMMADTQQSNNSVAQEEINLDNDDQTKIYKKKKRRRF